MCLFTTTLLLFSTIKGSNTKLSQFFFFHSLFCLFKCILIYRIFSPFSTILVPLIQLFQSLFLSQFFSFNQFRSTVCFFFILILSSQQFVSRKLYRSFLSKKKKTKIKSTENLRLMKNYNTTNNENYHRKQTNKKMFFFFSNELKRGLI